MASMAALFLRSDGPDGGGSGGGAGAATTPAPAPGPRTALIPSDWANWVQPVHAPSVSRYLGVRSHTPSLSGVRVGHCVPVNEAPCPPFASHSASIMSAVPAGFYSVRAWRAGEAGAPMS
jgi:hypothetical protein